MLAEARLFFYMGRVGSRGSQAAAADSTGEAAAAPWGLDSHGYPWNPELNGRTAARRRCVPAAGV